MGQRGRPRKVTNANTPTIPVATLACPICKKILPDTEFYKTNSMFFNGKITYCKKCIDGIYNKILKKYEDENREYPEKDAMRRLCMAFDVYWRDDVFETAKKTIDKSNMSLVFAYFKTYNLSQYISKTYDNTLNDDLTFIVKPSVNKDIYIDNDTIKFFGSGFSDDDYVFLRTQYDDWTARHECKTKVQEEIFKQICFTQLDLLKATRAKQDTKDLVSTFQKLLDSAKLQPKQNHNETVSDAQTFGTLLDKWENTRPLPEIDEDLKDVDRIGKYLDIFFRGHLAKMMGIKNVFCKSYETFMKKYSVNKPEYNSDDGSEVLFDAIFGGGLDE